ncbi:Pol polyprotein, partial [Nosema granulosis]
FVLTMIDHFTKVAEVVPLYSKDMQSVSKLIESRIIKKYGVPKVILTDNGKEFKNNLCEGLARKYGIVWRFGSPYNPTTTGLVERSNKTLLIRLRKISYFGKFDWAKCLRKAHCAYMYSYSRAILCAPIEMISGEILTGMDKQEGFNQLKSADWFKKNLEKTIGSYKNEYKKKRKNVHLNVGDSVWYKNILNLSQKLTPIWLFFRGKIVGVQFGSYKVLLENGKIVVANKKHVKKFKGEECWTTD